MSIGVVVADSETMEKEDSAYFIIDPEYRVGGMYSHELRPDEDGVRVTGRKQALKEIRNWLTEITCRSIWDMNGMILCAWPLTASTILPYRILRNAIKPAG